MSKGSKKTASIATGSCDICKKCGKYDDPAGVTPINWILCSHCDATFHCYCARINAIEYAILSRPTEFWFCNSCKDEDNGILSLRVNTLQSQLSSLQENNPNVITTDSLGTHLTTALTSMLPTITQSLQSSLIKSLEVTIDAKVNEVVDRKLDSGLDARINQMVDSAIHKASEELELGSENRHRVIECEINRAIKLSVDTLVTNKIGALAETLRSELQPATSNIPSMPSTAALVNGSGSVEAINDRLERQIRGFHLVLRILPHICDSNAKELGPLIMNIAIKSGYEISPNDIKTAFRLTSSRQLVRPILIKFTNTACREGFYSHYFKNLKRFDLAGLGLGEPGVRIFINEHLTVLNSKIFNAVRDRKRIPNSPIDKVITRDGLVYASRVGAKKYHPILSIMAIDNLPTPVVSKPESSLVRPASSSHSATNSAVNPAFATTSTAVPVHTNASPETSTLATSNQPPLTAETSASTKVPISTVIDVEMVPLVVTQLIPPTI